MFDLDKDIRSMVAQKLASLSLKLAEDETVSLATDAETKHPKSENDSPEEKLDVSSERGFDDRLSTLIHTLSLGSESGNFDLGEVERVGVEPTSILEHIDTPKE